MALIYNGNREIIIHTLLIELIESSTKSYTHIHHHLSCVYFEVQ